MARSLGQPAFFDYTASVRAHLHRFLLTLLILALPVQTFASAAMLGCVFSHPATGEPMAMAEGMMADCHEPEQSDTPAQHDCKHCAACALAAALPIPAADSLAIMPLRHSFIPSPATAFSGFIPGSPERPPRPTLA